MNRVKRHVVIILALFAFILSMGSALAQEDPPANGENPGNAGFAQIKADALAEADKLIEELDTRIAEYEKMLKAADPNEKAEYESYIKRLKETKKAAEKAKENIENCEDENCVNTEKTGLDAARGEMNTVIEETEQGLGGEGDFGQSGGRDTSMNEDEFGEENDPMFPQGDPDDAKKPTFADLSEGSDTQAQGTEGGLDDGSGSTDSPTSCETGGTWPNCLTDTIPNDEGSPR